MIVDICFSVQKEIVSQWNKALATGRLISYDRNFAMFQHPHSCEPFKFLFKLGEMLT